MRVLSYGMMGLRVGLLLAFTCILIRDVAAQDATPLKGLTENWENLPSSWGTGDPCGNSWVGIHCNNSRITEIKLTAQDLSGQLNGDLASLSELQKLDLSYNKKFTGPLPPSIGQLKNLKQLILIGCNFNGRIPESLGSLEQLEELSLNSNSFIGEVPATLGNLRNLYWLDLADNKLSGSIPVSSGDKPGLDLLIQTKHFHFGKNQLSGTIPPSLFNSSMKLIHVLFDNNQLSGSIPSTLGLLSDLQSVRFDRNLLSGDLPINIANLTNVTELILSNNALSGPIPDLTGLDVLNLLDLSNNNFNATELPQWIPSLKSLTTLIMENGTLQGPVPEGFFNIPALNTVRLRNNRISGTFHISSNSSSSLQLIDLRSNSIDAVTVTPGYNYTLSLLGNPVCDNNDGSLPYCKDPPIPTSSDSTPAESCIIPHCTSERIPSPNCTCAYPLTGTLIFRTLSSLGISSRIVLLEDLLQKLRNLSMPVESVALGIGWVDSDGYFNIQVMFFPDGQDYFNTTGVISLASAFSEQTYKPPQNFGPYIFVADDKYLEGRPPKNKKNNQTGIIVGAAIGSSILLLLLISLGGYAYNQNRSIKKAKQQANPFVSWDSHGTGGNVPQLNGARFFKLEELQRCTQNFSDANTIGSGGYGKVYKGILPDGQIVAIKRSRLGSMQGSREFKNEVELLSRVHHKNLVKLVGFCFDKGEQTLVYEFIPNGTLAENLSGNSSTQMDWIRRLMVTLGSARGLQYLHELADPPIIHRDIKSSNILLDERLTAKVADFGLSKLFGDSDQKGYVTTQVKGTMGYLDPEYFMTNQLTEKSDIFSFGVVMLEMVTARPPIQDGKYIVKEIKEAMDRTMDLYKLDRVMDPVLLRNTTMLVGFEKFVDLALKCVEENGANRPTMGEVVKEIEHIVKLAGMNPNADSASTSQLYEGASRGNIVHPYTDNSLFQ